MELTLLKQAQFGNLECDFWVNEENKVFMTIDQLSRALEYASKSGVHKIVQRNPYLTNEEFYVVDDLSTGQKDYPNTTYFTEDGIYEITMLSSKPKAREFRLFVRRLLKGLRKGELQITQSQPSQEQLYLGADLQMRVVEDNTKRAEINLEMEKFHLRKLKEQARIATLVDEFATKFHLLIGRDLMIEALADFRDTLALPLKYDELPMHELEALYIKQEERLALIEEKYQKFEQMLQKEINTPWYERIDQKKKYN